MEHWKTLKIGNKIVRSWAKELDELSMQQLQAMCRNDFIVNPAYLMADAHAGYGVPIGTVLQTKDVVIPNAVGVDIGCGMTCTLLDTPDTPDLKNLYRTIQQHKSELTTSETIPLDLDDYQEHLEVALEDHPELAKEVLEKIETQFGTMGGGNHFIEVGQVEGQPHRYYILVHSGSRGAGALVARHFNDLAKELNAGWQSNYTPDLNFIHRSSEQFFKYFVALELMDRYAKANRTVMSHFALTHLQTSDGTKISMEVSPAIDSTHNSATMYSSTDGHNYIVHHKGTNCFRRSKYVVVAGTQGTPSYICEAGPNAKESLWSCSHGAGRIYSRRKAKQELCLQKTLEQMDGIIHGISHQGDLDEAPDAYKDIEEVIAQQEGLIIPKHKLMPLMVFKD